jgi:hypothetical protein
MPQVNHVGYEAPCTLDGVDYNCTEWKGTSTTTDVPTTNTSNYDAVDDKCYSDAIRGVSTFEGSVKFNFDSNNLPYPTLRDGKVINLAIFKFDLIGHQLSGKFLIKTFKVEPESLDGLVSVEISIRNKGKYSYA